MTTRPELMGVIPRTEYLYQNRERLIGPRLDGAKKFGSWGMIELSLSIWMWLTPNLDGKLYHPINNPEEAAWWLNLYRNQPEFQNVFFAPAVEQVATGTFEIPDLGEWEPEPVDKWYENEDDEYTTGGK